MALTQMEQAHSRGFRSPLSFSSTRIVSTVTIVYLRFELGLNAMLQQRRFNCLEDREGMVAFLAWLSKLESGVVEFTHSTNTTDNSL
jgi:hypothetical protein